jgi:hypothetical protein
MTVEQFRALALSLPDAVESAHMNHPDFRIAGKIFASIAPDGVRGMVKLTAEQQSLFVRTEADVFESVNGVWGKRGATYIDLESASEASVLQALSAAWRNTAPPRLLELSEESSTSPPAKSKPRKRSK